MKDCSNSKELLRELYYAINDRKTKSIILKAASKQEKIFGDEYISVGFKYIERKLGCSPMYKIHLALANMEIIHGNYPKKILESFEDEFVDGINIWQTATKLLLKEKGRQRAKALAEKSAILFVNLFLYLKLNREISLLTFVIVNTMGLITFIVLDYDCYIVDAKRRARNPADEIKPQKKALAKTKAIRGMYQLVAGLGLIINISIAVNQWLQQAALF
ncbi:MAG: hypothetical protein K5769_09250 [Pseudobutyrivibrio sp.]|nr:hypothetical protein [Pseudobutyrivibrio sp.]